MQKTTSRIALIGIACLTALSLLGPAAYAHSKGDKEDKGKHSSESTESTEASSEESKPEKEPKEKKDRHGEEPAPEPQEEETRESTESSSADSSSARSTDDKKGKKGSSTSGSTTTSTDSKGGGKAKGGGDKCVSYYFRYTDGHVDQNDNWCEGNDIYRTTTPSLHVAKLHVSCSDTIYPDGTAEKADLDGHLVAEWWIIKDGKQCQGFTTTAEEPKCPAGTDLAGQPMPSGGVEDCDLPPELCPSGTDNAGQPMPSAGVGACNNEVAPKELCPAGTDKAGQHMPVGGVKDCDDDVLGTIIRRGVPQARAQAEPDVQAGVILPLTGGSVSGFLIVAIGLLVAGFSILRFRRPTSS